MKSFTEYVDSEKRIPEILDVESLDPFEQKSVYAIFTMSVINYDNLPVSFKSYDEGKVCFFKNEKGWNISYGSGGTNTGVFYAERVFDAVLLLLEYNVCDNRISEYFEICSKDVSEEEIANLNKYLRTDDVEFKYNFANDVFEKYKGYSRRIK